MTISRTNVRIIITHTAELEHPDFALESYTGPKVDATGAVHINAVLIDVELINLAETELARVERRASAHSQA
jgi:hypothetical protein